MAFPTLAECSVSGKTCTKCGETHPLDAFHKSTAHKDGRRNLCRNCRRDSKRVYRAARRKPRAPNGYRPRTEYRHWERIKRKYGITEQRNTGIGMLGDNAGRLMKAAQYLAAVDEM